MSAEPVPHFTHQHIYFESSQIGVLNLKSHYHYLSPKYPGLGDWL